MGKEVSNTLFCVEQYNQVFYSFSHGSNAQVPNSLKMIYNSKLCQRISLKHKTKNKKKNNNKNI